MNFRTISLRFCVILKNLWVFTLVQINQICDTLDLPGVVEGFFPDFLGDTPSPCDVTVWPCILAPGKLQKPAVAASLVCPGMLTGLKLFWDDLRVKLPSLLTERHALTSW